MLNDLDTASLEELQKLTRHIQALYTWRIVFAFCKQCYGERAVRCILESHPESDDEGGSYYNLDSVAAYDKEGQPLLYNTSLPFFKLLIFAEDTVPSEPGEEDDEEDEDDLQQNIRLALREYGCYTLRAQEVKRQYGFVLWDELPKDQYYAEYDLRETPRST